MIPAWLLGSLCIILVFIYINRPPIEQRVLSAARFFDILPQAKPEGGCLKPGHLRLPLPFWVQLLVLVLLTGAVLVSWVTKASGEAQRVGVWIVVDTSASMTTSQHDVTRMEIAHQEVGRAIARAERAGQGAGLCLSLSSFDLEPQHHVTKEDASAARQAVRKLQPRPLGTDLNLVRGLLNSAGRQPESECAITHFVVVSDLPAPEWVISSTAQVIWRDVGSIVDNVGFTNIEGGRHPFTGLVREVNIEITAFGKAPASARLVVVAPDGSTVMDEALDWTDDDTWQGTFSPSSPGLYTLDVSPGGAYGYDDHAAIRVGDGETIRVDWQLDDRRLPRQLGWAEDGEQPHLRVIPQETTTSTIPTLIVGNSYGQEASSPAEILDFYETSPLLADLNLDVAELLGIRGIELPAGFRPVLRDVQGLTWLAQRDSPPAAYVPGLPTDTDDNLGRFSSTAFFNAVRWLLREQPLPPLYTLTEPTPDKSTPKEDLLALHEDEGNTARTPRSFGSFDELEPVRTSESEKPIWPILLTLAVLLFLVERGLAVSGSEKWRS